MHDKVADAIARLSGVRHCGQTDQPCRLKCPGPWVRDCYRSKLVGVAGPWTEDHIFGLVLVRTMHSNRIQTTAVPVEAVHEFIRDVQEGSVDPEWCAKGVAWTVELSSSRAARRRSARGDRPGALTILA